MHQPIIIRKIIIHFILYVVVSTERTIVIHNKTAFHVHLKQVLHRAFFNYITIAPMVAPGPSQPFCTPPPKTRTLLSSAGIRETLQKNAI